MLAEAQAQAQVATVGAGWGESDVACAGGGAVMAPGAAAPQGARGGQGAVGGQGADSMGAMVTEAGRTEAQDSMVTSMMTEAGWSEAQPARGAATPRGLTAAVHAARGAPPTHAVEVDATIRRMFERFDVNRSGALCHRELGACLQSFGIDTTHSEAANALRAYDADANGVMELDEFARLVHQLGWAQGGGGHGLGFAAMANSIADREKAVAEAAGEAGGAGLVGCRVGCGGGREGCGPPAARGPDPLRVLQPPSPPGRCRAAAHGACVAAARCARAHARAFSRSPGVSTDTLT